MRVTKESLLNYTKSYVNKRVHQDRGLLCIYLIGSMTSPEPLINGTTDIDLVIVHEGYTDQRREILKISPEITFDILHLDQNVFTPPRKLRTDPWIGSSLCFDPVLLYERGHWFEFTQASLESNFFLAENVIVRSLQFLNEAKKKMSELCSGNIQQESLFVLQYLHILENASNAIACLSSTPLTDRVFMKDFRNKAEAIDKKDLAGELYGLILGEKDPSPYYDYFFNAWKYYLDYFGNNTLVNYDIRYHADRQLYYTKAVESLWKDFLPAALWIIAKSWSRIIYLYQLDENEYFHAFCSFIEIGPAFLIKRQKQIEDYLDLIEESILNWGKNQGIDETSQIYQ